VTLTNIFACVFNTDLIFCDNHKYICPVTLHKLIFCVKSHHLPTSCAILYFPQYVYKVTKTTDFFVTYLPSALSMILFMGRWKSLPACLSYQVVSVNEYDRAMEHLTTPGLLSIADVNLLHTRVTLADTYSTSCNDVDSSGFRDGNFCDEAADEEEEEEHRAC